MKITLFFTYNVSLSDWKNAGILSRELEIYKYIYKKYNVNATYVGNPLYDKFEEVLTQIKVNSDKPIIALLPRSRKQEIINILPY